MAYTKVFDNPYPGGWQDNPSVMTPITAAALQEHTDAIEHIEDYLASGGGGGGTGSSVSWNQIKKSGEKIATITIDGTSTDVYAATQGGGGGSVAWGSITGTLADQTDLKNEIGAKVNNDTNGIINALLKLETDETGYVHDEDRLPISAGQYFLTKPLTSFYRYIKSKLSTDNIKAVDWNQKTTSGTNIATIKIGGVATEIYAPTSGGGGDSVWGGITGTLSDQTDLQTALNGKLTTTNLGNALYNLTYDTATVVDGTKILSGGSGGTFYNRSALSLYNYIKSKILADKKIFEDEQVLSGTESTTYTFTDNAITEDSMINVYADIWGENPSSVAVAEHTCTIIFPPSALNAGKAMTCRITLEEGV